MNPKNSGASGATPSGGSGGSGGASGGGGAGGGGGSTGDIYGNELFKGLVKYIQNQAAANAAIEKSFEKKVEEMEQKLRTKLKSAEKELKNMKAEQKKFNSFIEESRADLAQTKKELLDKQATSNDAMRAEMKTDMQNEIRETSIKSIEVVGVISSVIALVLVFVDAATSLEDIRNAFYVLVLGTSALGLFTCILHVLLFKEINRFIYWIIGLQVATFVILGLVAHIDPWRSQAESNQQNSTIDVNLKLGSGSITNSNSITTPLQVPQQQ